MATPDLTPSSQTSAIALPVTGSISNVDSTANPLPLGIYTVPTLLPIPHGPKHRLTILKKVQQTKLHMFIKN